MSVSNLFSENSYDTWAYNLKYTNEPQFMIPEYICWGIYSYVWQFRPFNTILIPLCSRHESNLKKNLNLN
jgi:hypothetical protein